VCACLGVLHAVGCAVGMFFECHKGSDRESCVRIVPCVCIFREALWDVHDVGFYTACALGLDPFRWTGACSRLYVRRISDDAVDAFELRSSHSGPAALIMRLRACAFSCFTFALTCIYVRAYSIFRMMPS
jgi:hypothetical protein